MMLVTSNIIRESGHEVIQAVDGNQALALYQSEKPDLVILDVEMPGYNGYEVAERIRSRDEDLWVPIIFLTSFSGDDHLLMGINAGGDDYLTKPVSEVVLNAKLNAMRRISEMQNRLLEMTRELSEINTKLHQSSITDPLTGCFNRLYLDECILDEWMSAAHGKLDLSVLIIDIDNFKTLNDTNGHYMGDNCLIKMVHIFNKHIEIPMDKLCRYGGDEFVIVMPGTDGTKAEAVAQKLCKAVMDFSNNYHLEVPVDLSISIGCASCVPDKSVSVEDFLKIADQALYEAKNNGRNQVIRADMSSENYNFLSAGNGRRLGISV